MAYADVSNSQSSATGATKFGSNVIYAPGGSSGFSTLSVLGFVAAALFGWWLFNRLKK